MHMIFLIPGLNNSEKQYIWYFFSSARLDDLKWSHCVYSLPRKWDKNGHPLQQEQGCFYLLNRNEANTVQEENSFFFLFCDRDSQGKRKYFKMMMMETAAKVLFEKKVAGIFLLGLMITVKWGYCLHFSEEKSKQMTLGYFCLPYLLTNS